MSGIANLGKAEEGETAEARLLEAVKEAGADAAVITRLVRVEKKTEVTPGFYQPAPAVTFGFYPGYSAAWLGYYEPPTIYQRDIYISETSLYDLTKNQLVWSGTVQTVDPSDITKKSSATWIRSSRRSKAKISSPRNNLASSNLQGDNVMGVSCRC